MQRSWTALCKCRCRCTFNGGWGACALATVQERTACRQGVGAEQGRAMPRARAAAGCVLEVARVCVVGVGLPECTGVEGGCLSGPFGQEQSWATYNRDEDWWWWHTYVCDNPGRCSASSRRAVFACGSMHAVEQGRMSFMWTDGDRTKGSQPRMIMHGYGIRGLMKLRRLSSYRL